MALTHNRINNLWYNPTYNKFKQHGFVKYIFTSEDAEDFLRTGAYLIKEAEKRSNTRIPWDEQRRYEILMNPRLENAFAALGTEYLLKGVFLTKGYAINKLKPASTSLSHPILIRNNKNKLLSNEVHDLSYIVNHIEKLIDFSEFNKSQRSEEAKAKAQLKGERIKGITRLTIPFPTAQQILDYLHFKRNYALHRPFIIPEFKGITNHIFKLLNYISMESSGKSIDELAKLNNET